MHREQVVVAQAQVYHRAECAQVIGVLAQERVALAQLVQCRPTCVLLAVLLQQEVAVLDGTRCVLGHALVLDEAVARHWQCCSQVPAAGGAGLGVQLQGSRTAAW